MRPSVRSALANAALVLVSVTLTYLAASLLIFRFFLPDLSLNLRPHFPDRAEVFAQTSKVAYAPHDYVALLGDSYAEGQGDGLLAAGGDRARLVHSAHILHRLSGRDVISLGVGGAGSAQAMVRMPTRILRDRCFVYPVLEAPKQMLVYFYEGNDLDENGYVVNMAAQTYGAPTREAIARYIETRYAAFSPTRCYTELAETTLTMAQGVRFLDIRPALRAAAANALIHGPRDWNHFNDAGYRVLGETLATMLDDTASTSCKDWGARP